MNVVTRNSVHDRIMALLLLSLQEEALQTIC
jgi:hypothetical protein